MDIYAKSGTRVKCINLDKDAAIWGSNDDPTNILIVGKEYTVSHTEVHSWHTKVVLNEFPDKKFSSVHFK